MDRIEWQWGYALDVLPAILEGLGVNLTALAGAYTLAVVLGLVLVLGRRAPWAWVRWPVTAVIEFVRLTPKLVQLYVLFFVLPEFGIVLSALTTGIIGLGLHYSSFTSEVYRAGLDGISQGQWDAARALNLSRVTTYRDVVLPQVARDIGPAMGNYLLATFKDTPLLAAITVVEMLQTSRIVGSENFRYLEPLTITGLLFLLLSLLAGFGLRRLERVRTLPGDSR